MAKGACANYIDDIDFIQLEKNGEYIHVLFASEIGAMLPALDVANVAFNNYKRQDGCTRPPNIVSTYASHWVNIRTLQAFSMGQRTLREVYFAQSQPCRKFPIKMELYDYHDLNKLLDDRKSKAGNINVTIKDIAQQVQTIKKLLETLKQYNKKYGFKGNDNVLAEEYDKLLKEVETYRKYFAQTEQIRQQMGIIFPIQQEKS